MQLCSYCKENHPEVACPFYAKAMAVMHSLPKLKQQVFTANPPAPFVGQFGYPNVYVGVLSPGSVVPNAASLDDPRGWAKSNTQIPELVVKRSSLINSRVIGSVKIPSKITAIAQEVAMAEVPGEVEVKLAKLPTNKLFSFDSYAAPVGPRAPLVSARVVGNIAVSTKVDKVVSDTDMLAYDAVADLYKHGLDETKIMRMFSVGLLGQKNKRKLVPTRWAITATDDQIGRKILSKLRREKENDNYLPPQR